MPVFHLLLYLVSAALTLGPAGLGAQSTEASNARAGGETTRHRLEAVRISAPVTIDGRLTEAVWSSAPAASDFTQFEPDAGAPATQRTEIRVAYDDEAIYVGARMYDTHPDSIVARVGRRDEDVHSDWLHVGIDSYFDRRTAFVFGVNARGSVQDIFLYDDTNDDESWDAVWEAKAQIDSLGWTVEMRIPLSQLRFSLRGRPGAEQTWGINFRRHLARRRENSFWAPLPRDAARLVSLFGELRGLRDIRPPRRLEVQPYTVGRITRAPGDADNPFYRPTATYGSLGADVKYGLSSNLTLTATINPDFGQVEADPSVVNLSAYESFFSERRPFFVEGADIFRFAIGVGDGDFGSERLFYSRRIGRRPQRSISVDDGWVDAPQASTILAAAKLSGKTAGGWSLGVLDAVTAAEEARVVDASNTMRTEPVEPLTNYAVARAIRDFRGGQSAIGVIATATNRVLDSPVLDHLRSSAYAGGVDARHRFGGGSYEARAWVLGSTVRGSTDAILRTQRSPARYFQRPDADHLEVDETRTSLSGYSASAQVVKVGGGHWRGAVLGLVRSPGFEVNDLGFERETDLALGGAFVAYEQYNPGKIFRQWSIGASQWHVVSFGGEHLGTGLDFNAGFQFLSYWGVWGGINRELPSYSNTALRGGPLLAEPGHVRLFIDVYSDSRKPLHGSLDVNWSREDETGAASIGLHPGLNLRLGGSVDLSLRPGISRDRSAWQYLLQTDALGRTRYVFADLDQTTISLTARASVAFTPTLSLQFYGQPFISAGDFSGFKEVADPRAQRFADRFVTYDATQLSGSDDQYAVDVDRDGTVDLTFDDPDFNVRELRTNTVLRWEYRPGSTLFLVWSQGREAITGDGRFDISRDSSRLFRAPPTNVLLLKVSYWLAL